MWPTGHETHCQSPGEGLVSPIPKTHDFWGKCSQHYPGEQLVWPLSLTYSFPAQLWGGFWQMLRSWLDCPPLVIPKPLRRCLPSSLVAAHAWVHTPVCIHPCAHTCVHKPSLIRKQTLCNTLAASPRWSFSKDAAFDSNAHFHFSASLWFLRVCCSSLQSQMPCGQLQSLSLGHT